MNQIIEVRTGFELNQDEKNTIAAIASTVKSTVLYVVKPGRGMSYVVSHSNNFAAAGIVEETGNCISDNTIVFALKEAVLEIEKSLDLAITNRQ